MNFDNNKLYIMDTKFDVRVKDIKNMQYDSYIFKICSHVNFFSERCNY